jgi:hypothetical protein
MKWTAMNQMNAEQESSIVSKIRRSLDSFSTILEAKININNEVKKAFGKVLAPAFNSFDFWYLDENKTSEILAFFLNPASSHNQGDRFLTIFLRKIGKETLLKFQPVKVLTEHHTDRGRRIDIALFFGGYNYVIGIENKIYESTCDQEYQLADYANYLDRVAAGNYLLIYLAPENKRISKPVFLKKRRQNLKLRASLFN